MFQSTRPINILTNDTKDSETEHVQNKQHINFQLNGETDTIDTDRDPGIKANLSWPEAHVHLQFVPYGIIIEEHLLLGVWFYLKSPGDLMFISLTPGAPRIAVLRCSVYNTTDPCIFRKLITEWSLQCLFPYFLLLFPT